MPNSAKQKRATATKCIALSPTITPGRLYNPITPVLRHWGLSMIKTFNDLQFSRKMLVTFLGIGALMGTLAGSGIVVMGELGAIATRHVERGIAGTDALGRLMVGLREHRVIILSQMNATSNEQERKYADRFDANRIAIDQAATDYEPLAGEFAPQVRSLKDRIGQLHAVNRRIFEVKQQSGAQAALPMILGEGKAISDEASKEAKDLIALQKARANAANDAGKRFADRAFWFIVVVAAVGMTALFGIWRLLARSIAAPLADLSHATTTLAEGGTARVPSLDRGDELGDVARAVEQFRIAAVKRAETDAAAARAQQVITTTLRDGLASLSSGDLTARIRAEFPAEYAELRTNFNDALETLGTLIAAVGHSTEAIRTGSGEIAQASEDLARRTESSAASLEETAAAITQMDGRLKATAVSAARTVERADGAISSVRGGRETADEAVQAMTRVAGSAKGIDSVIEGLDKIAFQTRVLAMNAAVEAGRAGEAGRGFAVVADLVSALAMRAEEEAGRARDQLTTTQNEIVSAVEMVRHVDEALANISADVEEVHGLLGSIAADNQAQSTAITQISVAIGTMDQSTQQNAAMVEETSAAARNLSKEVMTLAEQTSTFKLSSSAGPSYPPRSLASAAPRTAMPAGNAHLRLLTAHVASEPEWQDF